MELTDADILDAMQHIPGYLDITTEDFRTIYHLAHHHAVGRLFGNFRAGNLMRSGIEPLLPDMPLDQAAKALVRSGYKALPVVDATGCVIGMLDRNRLPAAAKGRYLPGIAAEHAGRRVRTQASCATRRR